MPKIEASAIEKYQVILQKDPSSQVFAPLAEAYREMGMLKEAEQIARAGVKRHSSFASGYVVYARIMKDMGRPEDSLKFVQKAIELSPENILAHHLQAEVYLQSKRPKEALRAFKMVLFLNPQSERARKAVSKLESLTADEYDDDVFEMSKIGSLKEQFWIEDEEEKEESVIHQTSQITEATASGLKKPSAAPPRAMERMLSLIDAFIVRNDLNKAKMLLSDTQTEFGDHPEILQRMKLLHSRSGGMMATSTEEDQATPLKPLQSREKAIQQRKLEVLEMMLRNINEYRQL
ncbi:tetratricopeptide repeat protein [Bdellovibrio sp. HCB337]|uniref:tetratricopeptide repeat protein n=1 Tax=Bdellovibrio sp. HCB337 TaxID=3394358 RepID=UPI0039A73751